MSVWSFGFNQSLHHKSEAPVAERQHSSYQPNSYSGKINEPKERRQKDHHFDAIPSSMKDNAFKANGDGRESEGSAFCTKDNLLHCIAYVNQDLEMLGFPCLKFEDGNCIADLYFFINRLNDILGLYHKTVAVKEDLETKNHRLSCETNHHQSTCARLRREKNQLDREVGQEKEKTRQINLKYKQVSGKLKTEKEEVKRLLAVMESRNVQHKHDNNKKEREIISLKERLHQLLADKVPDRKVGMDLRNVLSSGEGRRATWKTNQAKLEEEMYQLVISNYEERQRELMLENEDLRDCMLSLQRQLSGLLKRTAGTNTASGQKSQSVETSFLHESHLLKEKENLSEQKKLFFEEKSAFEKERRAFTDAARHFCIERQAFQEERAKAQKLNPQNVSLVREKHSKSKGDASHHTRMLPATPVFSPAKESNDSGDSIPVKKLTMEEVHQPFSLPPGSTPTLSVAKLAESLSKDGETSNIPVLTVQNSPIVHFTPSTPVKQTAPSPLSLLPSLSVAASSSLYQSYASTKADIHTDRVEEAASLASIRAARVRIRSATQQDGS
ncbi:afadin-and alpha-actinin-binding protein [Elysia marginata]|uniref:Afadin-and alpha-actinin-binding protein n=1 Tax=Elysia marginata TaxID=1093978 RepID=A0AAV4H589_9GAST|nr:afadin-and alpha-actinin-binding protein [Elysia marginata]